MLFTTPRPKRKYLVLALLIISVILLTEIGQRISLAQASSLPAATRGCCRPTIPFPTERPEGLIPRMCGRLVYLVEIDTGVRDIGLIPCSGSAKPYIFGRHPRDLVPYYQFRNVEIDSGDKFCTAEYGCLELYIKTFKNYIGIDGCAACGINVPPTWTKPPLTPYTATPVPPTSTPYIPSLTPTNTSTLSPEQVTPTVDLFDLLRGTSAPALAITATSAPQAPILTPTSPGDISSTNHFWKSPLVLGIGLILILIGSAYFVWLIVSRENR